MSPFLTHLLLPFKALRMAGPLLISYLLVLGIGIYYAATSFDPLVVRYLSQAYQDFDLRHAWFTPSLVLIRTILIGILMPFALVAIVLPLRFVWISGKLDLKELLLDTLPAVQRALSTLYVSFWRALFSLVPALSMLAVYVFAIKDYDSVEIKKLFSIVAALVAIWSFWRSARLIAPVFIAIGGKFSALESIQLAHAIKGQYTIAIFLWHLIGVVVPLGLCCYWNTAHGDILHSSLRTASTFQFTALNFSPFNLSAWQIAILAVLVWFCVAQIACTAFRGVAELTSRN